MASNKLDQFRLNALMNSNDAPLDEEKSKLHLHIAEMQLEIANLDEEIAKASAVSVGLIERREDCQKDLAVFRSLVSIIRRLPTELWRQIFLFGYESSDRLSIPHEASYYPPLIIGHVCSRWRAISYTMPTFWRTLHLHINPMKDFRVDRDLIKQWLSRGYPLPLDISLSASTDRIGGAILEHAVLPFVACARSLMLTLSLRDLKRLLKVPFNMPMIEILVFNLGTASHINWNSWNAPAISFEKLSRLHTVALSSPVFLNEVITLPWTQLTELYLGYKHPVDDIFRLLSLATNLRKFSFVGWCLELQGILLDLASIIHRNLRDLNIIVTTIQLIPMGPFFFQRLVLPALRAVSLGVCGPIELTSLVELQSRSKVLLETLSLTVSSLPPMFDHIIATLDQIPSLVELRLNIAEDIQRYLKALRYVPADNSRHLVPHVTKLDLHLSKGKVDGQAIVDLIRTRWWPGQDNVRAGVTRLRFLKVDVFQSGLQVWFPPAVAAQLQEFERGGLVLEVTGFRRS